MSKLVTMQGASGAVVRLCLDQVSNLKYLLFFKCVWFAVCMQFNSILMGAVLILPCIHRSFHGFTRYLRREAFSCHAKA